MPTDSLKLFLTKLIDYAGLFPPANLALKPALENYRKYIECEDSWMMSQFIIPVNSLENLDTHLMENFNEIHPLKLSILSGDLLSDYSKIQKFQSLFPNKTHFTGLETRINDIDNFAELLQNTDASIKNNKLEIESFFELPYCEFWISKMSLVVSNISEFNKKNNVNFGFKLRCGGVEAKMFPSVEIISQAIIQCINNEIPIKFTAGLHHPIRHYNDSVQTKMYGFFNIFIGGMLAIKYNLNESKLNEILLDEDGNKISFTNEKLIWNDLELTKDEIMNYRKNNFISYGSCSFDEPREDLINLGIF